MYEEEILSSHVWINAIWIFLVEASSGEWFVAWDTQNQNRPIFSSHFKWSKNNKYRALERIMYIDAKRINYIFTKKRTTNTTQ